MLTTSEDIKTLVDRIYDEKRIVIRDATWDFYEAVLAEVGNRKIFTTYDRGTLELTKMSPSAEHSMGQSVLARMISALTIELEMDFVSRANTTLQRKDLDRALEPDECYYVANFASVLGKKKLDLNIDPPPDLAIEIDITRSSLDKLSIYAALGVPELWTFKDSHLIFLALRNGGYEEIAESLSFPGVTAPVFERFLVNWETTPESVAMRAFLKWVRENLKRSK